MKLRLITGLLILSLLCAAACKKHPSPAPDPGTAPASSGTGSQDVESAAASPEPEVVEFEFVPVAVDTKNFSSFKQALEGETADEITVDKDIDVTETILLDRTVIIPAGVTVTVKPGIVLYVDNGLLENSGSIVVEGATDKAAAAMLAITGGGGLLNGNTGTVLFSASSVTPQTQSPIGGLLRLNGGTLTNEGTVRFAGGGDVYQGGAGDVTADSAFENFGTVELEGGFLSVSGRLINDTGATMNVGSAIYTGSEAVFDNMGTLIGTGTVNGTPVTEFAN